MAGQTVAVPVYPYRAETIGPYVGPITQAQLDKVNAVSASQLVGYVTEGLNLLKAGLGVAVFFL